MFTTCNRGTSLSFFVRITLLFCLGALPGCLNSGGNESDTANQTTPSTSGTGQAQNRESSVQDMACSGEAGQGWCLQNPRITLSNIESIKMVDGQIGWAVGTEGSILKTIDGGETWFAQQYGGDQRLHSIAAVDHKTAWAVGTNGTAIKTTDGGMTWVTLNLGTQENLLSIAAIDDNNAWGVGNTTNENTGAPIGAIYKTSDGGITWAAQTTRSNDLLSSVSAVDINTAWAAGSGNLRKTTDGGKTWTEQVAGTQVPDQVFAVNTNTVWALANWGGTLVFRASNGGRTWTEIRAPDTLDAFVPVNDSIAWAASANAVYLTTDGGTT